ncbi:MAG: hypothetical protein ACLTCB_00820 [Merdibacter sp.]
MMGLRLTPAILNAPKADMKIEDMEFNEAFAAQSLRHPRARRSDRHGPRSIMVKTNVNGGATRWATRCIRKPHPRHAAL